MNEPTSPEPTELNEEILEEQQEEGEELEPPKPQQVVCSSCNYKKMQILSILTLEKMVTLNLVCGNCGTLLDIDFKFNGGEVKSPERNLGYLG